MNNDEKNPFGSISGLLSGKLTENTSKTTAGLISLPKAPNAIKFIESPDFLDNNELFPLQYEVIRDFFELLCPYCNDINRIHSKKDIPRNEQILFEYNICPICGLHKKDIADQLVNYNEMIGVMGMRSGKGVLVGNITAYILHELLGIDNIADSLGLVKNQELDGVFVAASGEQAAETAYGHFRGFYDASPWFQKHRQALLDLEISHPKYRRGDLYREADKTLWFKHKRLRIHAKNSNSGTLAGKTRIFGVIDELSRFDSGESKRSALEVYRVIKRSLLTIKSSVSKLREKGNYEIPDARLFCISSPIFSEDQSMKLLKQAEKQEKMFAFHRATWEANPTISKEDLAEEFETDPLGAERDYAARPPGSEHPYIEDPRLIELCIDTERPNIFSYRENYFDKEIQGLVFNYINLEILNVQYSNLIRYTIHCDPGRNNDSFCLAIGHAEKGQVVIDGALEVRPIPKGNAQKLTPRTVHFPSMTNLILELNKKLDILSVSYDRWNSAEQIDKLRDNNILTIGENLTRDNHVSFANAVRSARICFPKRENENLDPRITRNIPCSKALYELITLNDDGKKVDHGPHGSNDMIQCYVGVYRNLENPLVGMNKQEITEYRTKRALLNHKKSIGKLIRLRR